MRGDSHIGDGSIDGSTIAALSTNFRGQWSEYGCRKPTPATFTELTCRYNYIIYHTRASSSICIWNVKKDLGLFSHL